MFIPIVHIGRMQVNKVVEKKAALEGEISTLENRLQELAVEADSIRSRLQAARGGLAVLNELEAEQTDRSSESLLGLPVVTLREAIHDGAGALKKFTCSELERFIQSKYPHLQFKTKSMYFPLDALVKTGEVTILRPHRGKRAPTVYGVKESAEGELATDPAPKPEAAKHGAHTVSPKR
jgi:hypothetical protein